MVDEWMGDDEPAVRKMFGYLLRDHVRYQDGRHSEAPSLIFADADYEVGDGTCGLYGDGRRCNEPAIVYVRADALIDLQAKNERLREALGAALEDILNSDDPGAIRIIKVALADEREEGEGG